MIKWIVKKYLNKIYEDFKFQVLSLEQELGYADDNEIEPNEVIRLQQIHKEAIWSKNCLQHVIDKVIN